MNFYKRFIGDYQRDTGHLSVLEHGAYTLLLDAFYATERPLPENKNTLYRLVRANTKREREAVDFVLSEFWSLEGGKWLNRRALTEIEKASTQAETNRIIATNRESNRATNRSTNRDTNRATKGQPSHSHSQTPEPVTSKQPPKPPAHKLADVPEGFSHWYDAYPRKHGKHAAIKAWKKIKPSKTAAALMTTAIRNQVDQHHFQNGRGEDFIPNPATWLNQGRWEDELAPPPETSEQSRERAIDEHQVSRRYGRPLEADIAELDKMIKTLSKTDYMGLASLEAHRQNLIEELDQPKETQ